MGCVLMVSCGGNRAKTEAELSVFGVYVDSLDSALQGKWFTRMGVSPDADEMLAYLREALPKNGLDTSAFFVPQIAEDLKTVHLLAFDSLGISINEVLRRLDVNLQKAFVDYTTGQRYGFMRPDKVLNRMDEKVGGTGYAQLFDYEIKTPDFEEAKKQMASDDRITYLKESEPSNRTYQILQQQLASSTEIAERRKLAINLERSRWQIKQPEEKGRQIVVNIAAQRLWAVGGDSALSMKICCGAVPTKTPLLCSAISYMQVNPEWVIPFNIIKTDVANHGGDVAYFSRNNYWILDRKTNDTLNAKNVSSEKLKSGSVRVVQQSGKGNALGRIVFADDEKRRRLEEIIHPLVTARMLRETAEAGAPIVGWDVPLLYETGMDARCDEVWCVYITEQEQLRRVMRRDRLSHEAAQARIDSQLSLAEKKARAAHRISTMGSRASTRRRVRMLLRDLQRRLSHDE